MPEGTPEDRAPEPVTSPERDPIEPVPVVEVLPVAVETALEDVLSGEEVEPYGPAFASPEVAGPPSSDAAPGPASEGAASDDDTDDGEAASVGEGPGPDAGGKRKRKKGRKGDGGRPPKGAPPVAMEVAAPFAAVLPSLLQARLAVVLTPLAAARAGDDAEAIHDMRVGIRRLRAALDAARPFYGGKALKRQHRRAGRLAAALGQVRDHDVHLEFLRERLAAAAPDERAGLEALIAAIGEERELALAELAVALEFWGDDDSYAAEFRRFSGKVKAGKWRGQATVAEVAAAALGEKVGAFEGRAAVFAEPDGATPEDFHRLRIAAKRLRYALELFAPILGDEAGEAIADLRRLQDMLGVMHDRDVFGELIAWERAATSERELHLLEFATINPGSREERLAAVRELLGGPRSFAATAPGVYGLLIDANDEREGLEAQVREHWAILAAEGFPARLRRLAAPVAAPAAPGAASPDAADEASTVA